MRLMISVVDDFHTGDQSSAHKAAVNVLVFSVFTNVNQTVGTRRYKISFSVIVVFDLLLWKDFLTNKYH